ncbi:MAG TPA: class I SAM-dependent methyltransferase [Syntrophorhabdaceae bacterium]|jgi:hypothetical protein
MSDQIDIEKSFHGIVWNRVHDGYFSDPCIAGPLVEKVRDFACTSRATKIIDLGGGTGSLLSCIRSAGIGPDVSLLNLDDSPVQLDAARSAGFTLLRASVDSFSRHEIDPEGGRCLFVMRSVLHYFGKEGLRPVLRHILAQTGPGEYFIHQSASFTHARDANCANTLYGMMGTKKWYPTVAFLRKCLREEGWRVRAVLPAPPLRLRDTDLMERYNLDRTAIHRIRERLSRNRAVPEDVFVRTETGFSAFLHYSIYICTPNTG